MLGFYSCKEDPKVDVIYTLECSSNLIDMAVIEVSHKVNSEQPEVFLISESEWEESENGGTKKWTKSYSHNDFSSVDEELSVSYIAKKNIERDTVSASIFTHNLDATIKLWDEDGDYLERPASMSMSMNINLGEHSITNEIDSLHDYIGVHIESNGTIRELK